MIWYDIMAMMSRRGRAAEHKRGFNESNNSMTSRLSEWPCGERNGITAPRRLQEPKRNLKRRRSALPPPPPPLCLSWHTVTSSSSHVVQNFTLPMFSSYNSADCCYCHRSHLAPLICGADALMMGRSSASVALFSCVFTRGNKKETKRKWKNHGMRPSPLENSLYWFLSLRLSDRSGKQSFVMSRRALTPAWLGLLHKSNQNTDYSF